MVTYAIAVLLALAVVYLVVWGLGRTYLKFRGTRVITCLETSQPAAVEVDAGHAAWTSLVFGPDLRLEQCSRWPERRDCGQECLRQIQAAPEGCLVRTILARWYEGKSCVYCGKPLGEINWLEHKPAVLSPEGKSMEWKEVHPETIPGVLETHRPVCWNCHVAETFRHMFPDRAVDRERPGVPHATTRAGSK